MAIENTRYQKDYDSHKNDQRVISTLINGDIKGFHPENIRVVKVEKDCELGNHWRERDELFGVVGVAEFILEDIETKHRESYLLKTGDRLLVPARVAMKVKADKGTLIMSCSPGINRENTTHKYEIK